MPPKLAAQVKTARTSRLSLRFFILASSLLVSFISFAFVLGITSVVYLKTIEHNARRFAYEEAQQFYHSIPFLMGKGWSRDELLGLYNSQQRDTRPTHSIQLYRTAVVEARYGRIELPADADVAEACRTGCVVEKTDRHYVDTVYPLVAGENCFRCHENAGKGTILGALKVRQNLKPMVHEARNRLISLFFLLSPLPILMAIFIARIVNGRVTHSINLLGDKVIDVNSMRDLTTLELSDIRPGFVELDRIFAEIGKLVGKIRTVSVDKEIMELEIQMLEKFIITSEVIRDWKEHVSSLLLEINQVVDAYMLFCIFQVDEELYDIEIFWRSAPSDATKIRVEEEVLRKIRKENSRLAGLSGLHVTHNIAAVDTPMLEMGERDIDLQTKSLILESPQIGGVVGIGVQSESVWNNTRSLVIDSILTTLLNVVGSIKAIHKYTKDLEYYATRDPLTNLFNQRAFWELITYEVGLGERITLISGSA